MTEPRQLSSGPARLSPSALGISTAIFGLVVIGVIFSGIFRKPFQPEARVVTVELQHAAQLRAGDQVRLDGNVEGKVKDITTGAGEVARVKLAVERDAGPIYDDARARLRFKTLLGGAFYVEIDRGTKDAGPLGDHVIPIDRTSVQVEIEDVTGILQGGALAGLRTLPGETATALSRSVPPAAALRTLSDIAPDAAMAVTAARGEHPGDDLPRLIRATAATVEAVDSDDDEIRTLVSGAAATLRATGRRAPEIRATIAAAPSVTRDLTTTLARLDTTLARTRGLVARLQAPAQQVAPTLNRLRPTLISAGTLLRDATPLVRLLPGTLDALAGASRQLVPLIDSVKPSLARFDDKVLPYLGREDPITGKSTTVMIGGFAAGFGGVGTQQDANGHFVRFPAALGTSSAYLPCKSSLIDPSAASQLACDDFNAALTNYLKYLPELGPAKLGTSRSAGR